MKRYILTLVLLVSVICSSASAQSFYSGETLRVIIPYGAGGGSDTWARAIAPFLQEYLGSGATVQVVNEPGASGVAGANQYALRTRQNGLTVLGTSGSNALPYVLGSNAVRYDFEDFTPITGSAVGGVVYASSDVGLESASDLCDTRELLVYGGIASNGLDLVPLLSFELLNLEVFEILGYGGRGPARVALEQGETTLDYQTSSAYIANVEPLVEEGTVTPLYTFGLLEDGEVVRDPQFPDLPTLQEVYTECNGGEAPSGVAWDAYKAALAAGFAIQKIIWVHEDAPAEAVTALQEAARQMIADPEFQEVKLNLIGDYEFVVGDEVRDAFDAASSLTPETLTWLQDFVANK